MGSAIDASKKAFMNAVTMHTHTQVVKATILALQALFAMFIYHYVVRLERIGCACASDYKRTYIKWFALALFGVVVVEVALIMTGATEAFATFTSVAGPIMAIAGIVYVVFIIQYINRLRAQKCACSATVSRSVVYIIAIIQAMYLAFSALMLLALLVIIAMHAVRGK